MSQSHNGNESHEYEVNRDDFKWLHVIVSVNIALCGCLRCEFAFL